MDVTGHFQSKSCYGLISKHFLAYYAIYHDENCIGLLKATRWYIHLFSALCIESHTNLYDSYGCNSKIKITFWRTVLTWFIQGLYSNTTDLSRVFSAEGHVLPLPFKLNLDKWHHSSYLQIFFCIKWHKPFIHSSKIVWLISKNMLWNELSIFIYE